MSLSPFQFHSLAPMYYRGSAAAVIVYDITKLVRTKLHSRSFKSSDASGADGDLLGPVKAS